MKKEKVIKSLVTAFVMVMTQITYSILFGRENILIGTTMAMAAASFLNRDFTLNPIYRIFMFLILNISLGIISYIASLNIYIGLVLNLTTIFTVTYLFMNEFRTPTSFLFLMTYIFIWSYPITINNLPERLVALSFGIVIIMLGQLIFNRNTFKNKTTTIINEVCNDIEVNIDSIIKGDYETKENIVINNKLRKLLHLITERNHKKFYSSVEGKIKFNICVSLERINIILNKINKENYKNKEEFLIDFKIQIKNIKLILKDQHTSKVDKSYNIFIQKYKNEEVKYVKECLEVIKILKYNIEHLNELDYKYLKQIDRSIDIPKEFKLLNLAKKNLNLNTLRFRYSLRLATAIAFTMFICDYFQVAYGKWIVISIYVLIQPYLEDTKAKSKKRFIGTSIGILIFLSVFSMIGDNIPKLIIIFIAFFMYFYFDKYQEKVIGMTIVALTSVSLAENINIISINRFLAVSAGILIALFFNKVFLPYNISDSIKELKDKYNRITNMMVCEIKEIKRGKKDQSKIISLILLSNTIESKLMDNNYRVKDKSLEVFLFQKSIFVSEVRFFTMKMYYKSR